MGSRALPLGAAEEAGSRARPLEAAEAEAEGLAAEGELRPLEAAEEAANRAQLPAEAEEACQ